MNSLVFNSFQKFAALFLAFSVFHRIKLFLRRIQQQPVMTHFIPLARPVHTRTRVLPGSGASQLLQTICGIPFLMDNGGSGMIAGAYEDHVHFYGLHTPQLSTFFDEVRS